jgi:hypothetical protein
MIGRHCQFAATSPDPAVTEYGAFTPGAQTQLESVFLLKDAGTGTQTISGAITLGGATTISANTTQTLGTFDLQSYAAALTLNGNSGNAQNYTNGLQLNAEINQVTTANANNNSCILPPSAPGMQVVVANFNTAVTFVIFPTKNEAINFSANNAGYSLATNNTTSLYCAVKGTWMASQAAIA